MKVRDYFDDNVQNEIQEEIVRTFYRAYPDTKWDLEERGYPADYFKDVYGQNLRVRVDQNLRQLSKRFPEQIKAFTEPNETNSSHHVLLVANHILMTASAVQNDSDVPRVAIFRSFLASQTQYEFEPDEDTNILVPIPQLNVTSSQLYAIILHGPADNDRYLPGFIKVAFLDIRMNRLCSDIDLLKKYRYIRDEMLTKDVEKIPYETKIEINKEISLRQGKLL